MTTVREHRGGFIWFKAIGDFSFGFTLGGFLGFIWYRYKAGRHGNPYKGKSRIIQNKIQFSVLQKSYRLGILFGRWGGLYSFFKLLQGYVFQDDKYNRFYSVISGGLTSCVISPHKGGKLRYNLGRRWKQFKLGFIIIGIIECILWIMMPENPNARNLMDSVDSSPGHWLEMQREAEEKMAQINKLKRVARRGPTRVDRSEGEVNLQ